MFLQLRNTEINVFLRESLRVFESGSRRKVEGPPVIAAKEEIISRSIEDSKPLQFSVIISPIQVKWACNKRPSSLMKIKKKTKETNLNIVEI
jgi:hypothetical protein